jgi:acetolactate synthase-1/2/3 large subunit
MKLSDYVVNFIAGLGVKHVFMLPGGGAMHLNDSLGKCREIQFVCTLHEQGGAIAAEAYGQYTGLGVLMVTTGPGGTNAITGVAGAWLESTPMIVISGQVKSSDLVGSRGVRQIGFQEIDIVRLVSPITKYAAIVLDASRIREHLEEALWCATHGRKGPAWLDIPLDIQASDIEPSALAAFSPKIESDPRANIKAAASRTLKLLSKAARPIVLVGNGVRHAGAIDKFLSWAESIGLPILTTWKALDFLPESHPLLVGRPGAVGQRAANFAQQTSDVFVSIGARLDFGQTAYNHAHFAPQAKRVVVDIDPAEISKLQMQIEVSLCADADAFLSELAALTQTAVLPDWSVWRKLCQVWKERFPVILPAYRTTDKGVNTYYLVEVIGKLLREGDVLACGSSGACSEVTAQALPAIKGIRFINTHGLGAMGFGIPAALGACLASGGQRTICIDGDGGFSMNTQELAVVSRLALPIKFFVLNNGGYGSIRATQSNYFERRFVACGPESGLTLPNIQKTAESHGIRYSCVADQSAIPDAVEEAFAASGPIVCEVMMAPDQSTQPKVSSRQESDGKMITMPMEDLWPFLDRDEFSAIMNS